MPSGSCLCGAVSISYTGEPVNKALCHCTDCHKISGSAYSVNNIVPGDGFKVTGKPKVYTKTADSGKTISSYFCGECGSTLFREADAFEGMKIVKAGVLDDKGALDDAKPNVELFAPTRPSWVEAISGADQLKTMS